ncbi:hypothetical protein PAPYR_10672 [Paratrimastix pyriformis]|uniref:Uncharacterized protein n=1 Tax=Paratrimastix pyriformis TaxID=342808 RepID=A0ABQ8U5G2_9EUKA|nr:hypothetical protein PAPYR_10672 [Paratrimastix pyriformis]
MSPAEKRSIDARLPTLPGSGQRSSRSSTACHITLPRKIGKPDPVENFGKTVLAVQIFLMVDRAHANPALLKRRLNTPPRKNAHLASVLNYVLYVRFFYCSLQKSELDQQFESHSRLAAKSTNSQSTLRFVERDLVMTGPSVRHRCLNTRYNWP